MIPDVSLLVEVLSYSMPVCATFQGCLAWENMILTMCGINSDISVKHLRRILPDGLFEVSVSA